MFELVEVDSFEVVFVYFCSGLEDAESELGRRLADLYFIDHDENFSEVHLVFIVVTDELLVNLPGYLPKFPRVEVIQVKFSHVRCQRFELG